MEPDHHHQAAASLAPAGTALPLVDSGHEPIHDANIFRAGLTE
jgi:hypothetical protein